MNKKLHILISMFICLIGFGSITAQDLFTKANKQFELGAYDLAINNYQKLLSEDPQNVSAIGSLAEAYFRTQNYMEAIRWYEELGTFEAMEPRHILNYAHVMKSLGLYDKAQEWYEKYKYVNTSVGDHYALSCDQAKSYLQGADSYEISLFNGNSSTSDFGISFYGNNLIFCSFRTDMKREMSKRNFSHIQKQGNELFLCTDKTNPGFTSISFLKSDLKEVHGVGPLNFAGNKVAYTRNNFADGYKQISGNETDLNIFFGEVSDERGDFEEETAFIHNESGSSTAFPTFLNEGNTLIFSSNRIGGSGQFDLYVSHKEDGMWSYPINLGNIINSPGNEITPFVKGNTLYFSSDYHMGIGGYDIFKTLIHEDGTFGPVENLGKGINSPMDDYYFVVEPMSSTAYFSSNRLGGLGKEDIYIAESLEVPTLAISNDVLVPDAVDLDALATSNRSAQNRDIATTVSFEEIAVKELEDTEESNATETFNTDEYIVFEEFEDEEQVDLEIAETAFNGNADEISYNATSSTLETSLNIASTVVVGTDNNFDLKGAIKNAHNDIITTAGNVYFIQLASLSNSRGDIGPFLKLSEFGNIYKVHKGGTTKIRLGYFSEEAEAIEKLREVKNRGFRDAFIVYEPLITSQLELIKMASTQTYYEGDYVPKGAVSNYKVRLASYTDPLWFDTGSVKDIGEIEQWTKGDFTIFVLSGYISIEEAEAALIKALNRGYSEAHIVEDINGYLQKVQRN